MFTTKDFRVRKDVTYPHFETIIQSWYSPLLGNTKKNDDAGNSACVTIGIYKNQISNKNEVLLISFMSGIIQNSEQLLKHIDCLRNDYLNKTTTSVSSTRNPTITIFDIEKGNFNNILNERFSGKLYKFYSECCGFSTLDSKIHVVKPYLDRFFLTNMPRCEELRPDDNALLSLLLSYPEADAYSGTLAFINAFLYAKLHSLFVDVIRRKETLSHGFY